MKNTDNREPSKRGGSRPGSGRPAKTPGETLTRYMVRLRLDQIESLRTLPNASAVVRELIDQYFNQNPTSPANEGGKNMSKTFIIARVSNQVQSNHIGNARTVGTAPTLAEARKLAQKEHEKVLDEYPGDLLPESAIIHDGEECY
jgi:hypothetical protein